MYEPGLAATAKRVDELAPPSTPDFFDHDIRQCGVLPEHPVYSVKTTTHGDYVTAVVDTGTSAVNNKREITFVVVQTGEGPRIFDASDDSNASLRAELGQRLNALKVIEADKTAAMSFIRQAIEQPTADIYAPSLTALGTPSPVPASHVASVKAGLNQANRTAVLATLSDGSVLRYIVEKTDKGPRIWDSYAASASRVALADERERRETLALTDAEAVAFMKELFAPYVSSKVKHTPTPYGAGLAELISIDGQLTDGVPYLDGDIICAC